MKSKYNIEKFFQDKTEGFSPSPPDDMWNRINKKIEINKEESNLLADKNNNFFNKFKMLLFVSISIIGISGLFYTFLFSDKKTSKEPIIINSSNISNKSQRNYVEGDDVSPIKEQNNSQIQGEPLSNKKIKHTNDASTNISNNIKTTKELRKASKTNVIPENSDIANTLTSQDIKQTKTEVNLEMSEKKQRMYYLNVLGMNAIKRILIIDGEGNIAMDITKFTVDKLQIPIDISNLSVGAYSIKIETKGKIHTKRLNVSED